VKVDTQKLDGVVDMVGELVITQAMLGKDIERLASQDNKIYSTLSQLSRITSDLQRTSMSLRMVAIRQTFQKMTRLVRDLSKKSGKPVSLEMVGEDTEIDRTMVDDIYDPLVHMVRNAIDHGIEDPDARKTAGKPEKGRITLKAYHKGGNIVIQISEDGKGLDREKIVRRAVEKGLISAGTNMSDY
jgi:two-component system chemotaxis sensor kinase CheA